MSYSAYETYEIYNEQFPRARKAHTCSACKETIPSGIKYARIFVLFEKEVTIYKRCLRCQKIHEHLRKLCYKHYMWPDERLNCGLNYADEWGQEPPPEIAALAFALPGDI